MANTANSAPAVRDDGGGPFHEFSEGELVLGMLVIQAGGELTVSAEYADVLVEQIVVEPNGKGGWRITARNVKGEH